MIYVAIFVAVLVFALLIRKSKSDAHLTQIEKVRKSDFDLEKLINADGTALGWNRARDQIVLINRKGHRRISVSQLAEWVWEPESQSSYEFRIQLNNPAEPPIVVKNMKREDAILWHGALKALAS